MNLPKEKCRKYGMFHMVDPDDLEGIEEYAEWLESILHNPCSVWEEDGEEFLIETRQLVARVNGLNIVIYPNEHPPPHFHVKSPNVNASFTIENCEKLEGNVGTQELRKIRFWHKSAKPLLVSAWNETRPTNCSVGVYHGT